MVSAESPFSFLVIDHWIVETANVAGGLPDFGVHDDGAIDRNNTDGVAIGTTGWSLDDILPPGVLEIAFKLRTKRAIVPETIDTAVNLGGLPNKPTPPTEGDDVVHRLGGGS